MLKHQTEPQGEMPSQISENTKPEHSQGEGLASHRVNLASFPPGPHIGMQPVTISKSQSTCGKNSKSTFYIIDRHRKQHST